MMGKRGIYTVWLGVVLWLCFSTEVLLAADFSLREWTRDMDTLQTKVFAPLADRFESTNPEAGWHDYVVEMLDAASINQGEINAFSYGVLRDTTLTMSQDFTRFADDGSWSDAAYYLRTKLDLITRVLGYLELDRN